MSCEISQLLRVARCREPGQAHVVRSVEAMVVDPDRMTLDRREREVPAIVGNQVEPRLHVLPKAGNAEAALSFLQLGPGRSVEERDRGDVDTASVALELDEGAVLRGKALV